MTQFCSDTIEYEKFDQSFLSLQQKIIKIYFQLSNEMENIESDKVAFQSNNMSLRLQTLMEANTRQLEVIKIEYWSIEKIKTYVKEQLSFLELIENFQSN